MLNALLWSLLNRYIAPFEILYRVVCQTADFCNSTSITQWDFVTNVSPFHPWLFSLLCPLQRSQLCFGQHNAVLCRFGFQCFQTKFDSMEIVTQPDTPDPSRRNNDTFFSVHCLPVTGHRQVAQWPVQPPHFQRVLQLCSSGIEWRKDKNVEEITNSILPNSGKPPISAVPLRWVNTERRLLSLFGWLFLLSSRTLLDVTYSESHLESLH